MCFWDLCKKRMRLQTLTAQKTNIFLTSRKAKLAFIKRPYRNFLWILLVGFVANSQATIDVPSTLYIEGSSDYIYLAWDCEAGAYPECEFQQNGNTLETTRSAHESTRVTLTPGINKFRILRCWLRKSGYTYYRQNCLYGPWKNVTVYSIPSESPTPNAPSNDVDGSYTVSWSATANTALYKLYERYNNGSWVLISNSSNRSKSRSGKGEGNYDYRLKSCQYGHCAGYGSIRTVHVEPPEPVGGPVSKVYSYDALGRLRKVKQGDKSTDYDYDSAGNRESRSTHN